MVSIYLALSSNAYKLKLFWEEMGHNTTRQASKNKAEISW